MNADRMIGHIRERLLIDSPTLTSDLLAGILVTVREQLAAELGCAQAEAGYRAWVDARDEKERQRLAALCPQLEEAPCEWDYTASAAVRTCARCGRLQSRCVLCRCYASLCCHQEVCDQCHKSVTLEDCAAQAELGKALQENAPGAAAAFVDHVLRATHGRLH